jgi:hypothetical protein
MKSSAGTRKFNSSNDRIDAISDDVKQSERTNDMIAKKDPTRDMFRKFKA